jgi:hypothetical protein
MPLRAEWARTNLGVDQLWWRYIGIGGAMSIEHMVAALDGADMSRWEHDHLAQVMNEYWMDHDGDHPVAYSDEVD